MPEKYKWTQEDADGFVTTEHGADVIQDENEKRRILQDLGKALMHAGFNDGYYPQDMSSKPYVRGAISDSDYTIIVPSDKLVKVQFGEYSSAKTIFLRFTGENPEWSADGSTWRSFVPRLEDLENVEIQNLADGDVLKYDATIQKWKNSPVA